MSDYGQKSLAIIEKYMSGGPSTQVVAASIEAYAILELARQQRIANLIEIARGEREATNSGGEADLWNRHIAPELGLVKE